MSLDLHLRRVRQAIQTLGLLSAYRDGDRVWTCVTSELPWKENENEKSCIPPAPGGETASYHVAHRKPPEWSRYEYPHFILHGVPERSAILIHRGNYVSDTAGCILVGRALTDIDGDGMSDITHSTETLMQLVELVPDDGAELQIRWSDAPDPVALFRRELDVDLNEMIADAQIAEAGA